MGTKVLHIKTWREDKEIKSLVRIDLEVVVEKGHKRAGNYGLWSVFSANKHAQGSYCILISSFSAELNSVMLDRLAD